MCRECDETEEINPLVSSTDEYGKKIRQKPQMNGTPTKFDANEKESNAYIQQIVGAELARPSLVSQKVEINGGRMKKMAKL
jgi:hypothetical protein